MTSTAATKIVFNLLEGRAYETPAEAAQSVPPLGWHEWQAAGVQFSRFHKDGTPFALPFRPEAYLWAGPFTLWVPKAHQAQGQQFRRGHFRRGVKKYANMLARGQAIPPVVLLYHEPWGWTMQDGNHRYEALVKAGAATYDAFLGKPKQPAHESEADDEP